MKTRVHLLKCRARFEVATLRGLRDEFSCGASLAAEISPRVAEAERALDETLDALAALDPLCPKGRCRDGAI